MVRINSRSHASTRTYQNGCDVANREVSREMALFRKLDISITARPKNSSQSTSCGTNEKVVCPLEFPFNHSADRTVAEKTAPNFALRVIGFRFLPVQKLSHTQQQKYQPVNEIRTQQKRTAINPAAKKKRRPGHAVRNRAEQAPTVVGTHVSASANGLSSASVRK
jgi:hypothetical protein